MATVGKRFAAAQTARKRPLGWRITSISTASGTQRRSKSSAAFDAPELAIALAKQLSNAVPRRPSHRE